MMIFSAAHHRYYYEHYSATAAAAARPVSADELETVTSDSSTTSRHVSNRADPLSPSSPAPAAPQTLHPEYTEVRMPLRRQRHDSVRAAAATTCALPGALPGCCVAHCLHSWDCPAASTEAMQIATAYHRPRLPCHRSEAVCPCDAKMTGREGGARMIPMTKRRRW